MQISKQTVLIEFILLSCLAISGPAKKTTSPKATKPTPAAKFGVNMQNDGAILYTQGIFYLIQAESITSGGNILYFGAKDFTNGKDLIVRNVAKSELKVNTPERKMVKTTMLLGQGENIDRNYRLDVFTEIHKDRPYLAIYSRFFYLGPDTHNCSINWGVESAYEKNRYKYYTIPKEGKILTYKLDAESVGQKLDQEYVKWVYVHDGKGNGAGLIPGAAMFGKGADFIFVNAVPPQKDLTAGQSIDVFMVFVPINKNFKIIPQIQKEISTISWKFE